MQTLNIEILKVEVGYITHLLEESFNLIEKSQISSAFCFCFSNALERMLKIGIAVKGGEVEKRHDILEYYKTFLGERHFNEFSKATEFKIKPEKILNWFNEWEVFIAKFNLTQAQAEDVTKKFLCNSNQLNENEKKLKEVFNRTCDLVYSTTYTLLKDMDEFANAKEGRYKNLTNLFNLKEKPYIYAKDFVTQTYIHTMQNTTPLSQEFPHFYNSREVEINAIPQIKTDFAILVNSIYSKLKEVFNKPELREALFELSHFIQKIKAFKI